MQTHVKFVDTGEGYFIIFLMLTVLGSVYPGRLYLKKNLQAKGHIINTTVLSEVMIRST